MKKLRVLTLIGLFVASLAAPLRADDDDIQVPNVLNAPPAAAVIAYDQPVIAITHVRVVDGTGAAARPDQTVVIDHGKIRAVGPSASVTAPSGSTTIDGTGHTLTPGFVGTHDHLYYVSGGPLFITREMPFSFPRLYLGAGVTTIRTAGSLEPYTDLHIAEAIRRGELVGPHMDVTSVYLTGWEPFFVQMGALRNPADAKRTVDFWADRGVTSFKLYTSLPPDIARAAIAAAHAPLEGGRALVLDRLHGSGAHGRRQSRARADHRHGVRAQPQTGRVSQRRERGAAVDRGARRERT